MARYKAIDTRNDQSGASAYRMSEKRGKNDAADAAAICEAVTRPPAPPSKSLQHKPWYRPMMILSAGFGAPGLLFVPE